MLFLVGEGEGDWEEDRAPADFREDAGEGWELLLASLLGRGLGLCLSEVVLEFNLSESGVARELLDPGVKISLLIKECPLKEEIR